MLSKKKLAAIMFSGILAVGVCVSGATYAIFTNSASNTNNSFASGTIILTQDRGLGDTIHGPMFYSGDSNKNKGSFAYDTNENPYRPPGGEAMGGWAPGDKAVREMIICNEGTLQAKINKIKANVNEAGVTSGDAYKEFIKKMKIKVTCSGESLPLYSGNLEELLKGYVNIKPKIVNPNGAKIAMTFEAELDIEAGNAIQGQNFVFDFTFSAEQTKNNL